MKVLLIGSGGREHALAWKLAQSPKVTELLVAPGSDGIAQLRKVRRVPIAATDIDELVVCAHREAVSLTVVGPEAPLVSGIVDKFRDKGLAIFGPTRDAARLEGSKAFAKRFMVQHDIPTAEYQEFSDPREACQFVEQHPDTPWVVKADGLASGKGVIVPPDPLPPPYILMADTMGAVKKVMVDRQFGEEAGRRIVLEKRLLGEEASVIGIADGHHALVLELEAAQDHKRLKDDDQGPNTGGMGAYSPAPIVTDTLLADVRERILKSTVMGMALAGTPFCGFLYAGLMITDEGPKVLEYNVRFGDPEAQAILPRLKTDLVSVMLAAVGGRLNEVVLEWDSRPCVCVVLAARGYPEKPQLGDLITGLEHAEAMNDVLIFHAGTRREHGQWATAGGRVLNVVALGQNHAEAVGRAYEAMKHIHFDGMQVRMDIGQRALRSAS